MSISLSSSFNEPIKLQPSKYSTLKSNKSGGIKRVSTLQQTGRYKNDHSIEAKSPLKISMASLKKEDLTFRNGK